MMLLGHEQPGSSSNVLVEFGHWQEVLNRSLAGTLLVRAGRYGWSDYKDLFVVSVPSGSLFVVK